MDLAWQDAAVCQNAYPEVDMIVMDAGRDGRAKAERLIAKYCAGCTVQQQCAQWALVSTPVGIWGGVFVPIDNHKSRRVALATLRQVASGILRVGDAA